VFVHQSSGTGENRALLVCYAASSGMYSGTGGDGPFVNTGINLAV
jgi:hypothetical protein